MNDSPLSILTLVTMCRPGDTINLRDNTVIPRSFYHRVWRWWQGESRKDLIKAIQDDLETLDLGIFHRSHITIREYQVHSNHIKFVHSIIQGLEALCLTYSSDENFVSSLRKMIQKLRGAIQSLRIVG